MKDDDSDEFITYETMDYVFNEDDFVAAEGERKVDAPAVTAEEHEPLGHVSIDTADDEPIAPEDIDFSLFETGAPKSAAKPLKARTEATTAFRREARPIQQQSRTLNETRTFAVPEKKGAAKKSSSNAGSQNPVLKVLKAIGGALAGVGILLLYLITLPFTSGKNKKGSNNVAANRNSTNKPINGNNRR